MRRRHLLAFAITLLVGLAVWIAVPPAHAAKATLTWEDKSSNEEGFNAQRRDGGCGAAAAWAPLAQIGQNVRTYVDLTVAEGGSYCYRVNAYNQAGASSWSNEAGITIPYTVPPPPSGAGISANRLTWADNSPNETEFVVQRKAETCAGAAAFEELVRVPANATSYTDAAVAEGQAYCYRVGASNPAGVSPWSNTAERTVPWTIPVAPGQLDVVAGE
jgi:hypothetical protein